MTLHARNFTPCDSAARATAAASISTACAPKALSQISPSAAHRQQSRTDQDSLSLTGVAAAAVCGVDDMPRSQDIADLQSRIKCPCEPAEIITRAHTSDHRFRGPPCGFRSHASADNDRCLHSRRTCMLCPSYSRRVDRPVLHKRRDFTLHGATTAILGMTYPFAVNHCTARRKASSTGTVFHPSSRSALAEVTNIFLRPMRTASMVALGSLPKIRPVNTSSTTPVARATTYGTLTSAMATL